MFTFIEACKDDDDDGDKVYDDVRFFILQIRNKVFQLSVIRRVTINEEKE
jgi:hypothetical protein